MKFQIRKLIVWPKQATKKPRVICFEQGKVNVISGKSNTGKSALIKIVDYVLASGSCNVPVGPIRNSASWFGLLVQTSDGLILIARREPGGGQSTDDYMVEESPSHDYDPAETIPLKNTSRTYVKKLLQRLSGLPNLDQDYLATGSGFKGQPSFGDLKAFLFQPQSVVASETTLFYKTDEEGHYGKLKEVFPFALGAINGEILLLRHRLQDAERRAASLSRKIHRLEEELQDALSEIRPKFLLGVQLGLLPVLSWETALPMDGQLEEMRSRLVQLAKDAPSSFIERGDPTATVTALSELQSNERRFQNELFSARARLRQIQELRKGFANLRQDKSEQLNRLRISEWLQGSVVLEPICPICGSSTTEHVNQWESLIQSLDDLKRDVPEIARALPQLQREEIAIVRRINQIEVEIRSISAELSTLETSQTFRADDLERARFIGQLQQWSISADDSERLQDYREQLAEVEAEMEALRRQVSESNVETRMAAVLTRWTMSAQHYVGIMHLEEHGKLLQLDIPNLTIRIVQDDGRAPRLSEIGGGHNWLGYHLATLLALHEIFAAQGNSCVPSLLMLDQPSQTQFPDSDDEDAEQEDLAAVSQAFQALDEGIRRTRGALQVIVTEHGGAALWKDSGFVFVVERWRRGRSLIPWHWMDVVHEPMVGKRADHALLDQREGLALALSELIGEAVRDEEVKVEDARFERFGIRFSVSLSRGGKMRRFFGGVSCDLSFQVSEIG